MGRLSREMRELERKMAIWWNWRVNVRMRGRWRIKRWEDYRRNWKGRKVWKWCSRSSSRGCWKEEVISKTKRNRRNENSICKRCKERMRDSLSKLWHFRCRTSSWCLKWMRCDWMDAITAVSWVEVTFQTRRETGIGREWISCRKRIEY